MIDKTEIEQIVKKIAEKVKPEKIILFGSYASGNPDVNSDIDICVVVKEGNGWTGSKIRRILWGALLPMDIIVYSEKEIDEWKNVKQALPTIILNEGKVLYEKK